MSLYRIIEPDAFEKDILHAVADAIDANNLDRPLSHHIREALTDSGLPHLATSRDARAQAVRRAEMTLNWMVRRIRFYTGDLPGIPAPDRARLICAYTGDRDAVEARHGVRYDQLTTAMRASLQLSMCHTFVTGGLPDALGHILMPGTSEHERELMWNMTLRHGLPRLPIDRDPSLIGIQFAHHRFAAATWEFGLLLHSHAPAPVAPPPLPVDTTRDDTLRPERPRDAFSATSACALRFH